MASSAVFACLSSGSGTGLRFTVLIDRAFDIADCDYRGMAIGWHSPAGFRHPGLAEYEGEGGLARLRSFSGLMITCGLDHILFIEDEPADHYVYGPKKTVSHSIHGRIGTIPGKLSELRRALGGRRLFSLVRGTVSQGTVFGEESGTHAAHRDQGGQQRYQAHRPEGVNRGFYRTPHMYCYHINAGHPVLAEGPELISRRSRTSSGPRMPVKTIANRVSVTAACRCR